MAKFEASRENLLKLKKDFDELEDPKSLNEANTRLKFIDRILCECLDWELTNISVEDHYEGNYTDYILSLFRSVAVVEAKKTGIYFELPVGTKKIIQPLKTLYRTNSEVQSAIEQVKAYCNDRAIKVAILSNGFQIIAFVANRTDSVPPLEGNALVVESYESFTENFQEIWNCLSKSGFEDEYLSKKLIGTVEEQLPPKIASTIYKYPGLKGRNPFQTEIETISDLVLEDVIKDKNIEADFLDNCYCTSGALSSYSMVSKAILTTRYDYLFEKGDNKTTLEQVTGKKGISKDLMDIFSGSLSKRPVLLVGDVGVGKSTFIDYLRLIHAPQVFNKSLTFKIDLGSQINIALNIRLAVINEIKNQLNLLYKIDIEEDNFVRHCYHVELGTFKNNVRVKRLYEIDDKQAELKEIEFLAEKVDDEVNHLKSSLEYICKSQKKQIIVFIDNCDQRSDEDQEKAFLISNEFATSWPMIVFISLRPETYHKTKKEKGALSGYHTKAFTIPPPRLDEVIQKRLDFAQRITSGELPLSVLNTQTSFSKLHSLIEVYKYSLEVNSSLLTFISNVSNDNIRKAIELIKKFFGSGHVDMGKILTIYETEGHYTIPIHEMLRAIIFGDNEYYSPQNSDIINLFEVRFNNPNEHFILPMLIALLDDYSKNSRDNGFVNITEVYSYLQGASYNIDQIDSILNYAYSKKLFEISQKGDLLEVKNTDLKIRATNLALYHLRFLIKSFTYIDAIIVDIPIFSRVYREKINNVFKIEERLNRTANFKQYMDECWEKSKLKSAYFDWNMYSGEIANEVLRISEKVALLGGNNLNHGIKN